MKLGTLDDWKVIGSIFTVCVSFAGWLAKRKGAGSWLSRRLNVEKDLMMARQTIRNQEAEIVYLMAALERARESQKIVQEAITISALKSAKPSDASTTSPTG